MKPLQTVRQPLLDLHRALIEAERKDYEREHGAISAGEFLQKLISEPSLEWLKPLTGLVAQLDEVLADKKFDQHYREALQRDPDLLVAHGKLVKALKQ